MALYGIYGSHTVEACPLFNDGSRRLLLQSAPDLETTAQGCGVKVVAAYHSGLEHTFVWVVESESAHAVEDLMVQSKMAQWNAMKTVPLRTFQDVVASCRSRDDEADEATS